MNQKKKNNFVLMSTFLSELRRTEKYEQWRKEVYKQQKKRCQVCREKKKVQIHHIIPLAKIYKNFISRYGDPSDSFDVELLLQVAENHEDFWDVDNGIVLCNWCHQLEHPDKVIF